MSDKKKKVKVCPECGSMMESVEIKNTKDGITYSKIVFECIECEYCDTKKTRKNRSSLRDWGME